MSYDPSHRRPPRQERWPNATPQEGWPAYVGAAGNGRAAANGYGGADGSGAAGRYGDTWDGSGAGVNAYAGATGGYPGYAGTAEAYPATEDSFDGGYGGATDEYAGDGAGHQWNGNGYEYDARPPGYGWDGGRGGGYPYREEYAEPDPATRSDPLLIAPDTVVERGWRPDRAEHTGRGRDRSGPVIGAVVGFLAAAVAIGVSTFAAAFVRPQASPIIAVGGAFIDRTPSALKNFAVQHFGENDKTVLLGGMYVTIALIAMVIGCLARRNVTIGVAGIAVFGLFGAFVAVTRPEARVTDVVPSVIGGLAGVAALLWLARAAAPVAPVRASRGSARASSFRHAHSSEHSHRRAR